MEIANILTLNKLNIGTEFNVVSSIEEITNVDLPLLIIGYGKAIELFGNLNIMNRQINQNTFWTFDRIVDRMIYERDLEEFIRHSFRSIIKNLNYVDVDFIQTKKNKLSKIVRKLLSINNVITYRTENDVYYILHENIVFGLDLNVLEFMGYNKKKIHNKIISKSSTFIEGSEILIEYNNRLEQLNYDYKYVPFLYSINPYD